MLVTRCPACGTSFKVVKDQLKLSQGWVRCGHCGEAFHAASHFLPTAAQHAEAQRSAATASTHQPATVTTAHAQGSIAAPASEAFSAPSASTSASPTSTATQTAKAWAPAVWSSASMIASRQPTVADEPPPRGAAAADHAAPPGLAPAAGPAPADPADRTLDLSREDMAEALAQALNAAAASRLAGHADAAEVAQATQDEAGPRGPELQQPAAIGGAEVMHEADEALPMLAKRVQPMTAEDGTQLAPRIEVESTFMPSTGAGFTSSELREAGETLIRFPATAVHVATDIGADIAGDDGLPSGPTSIGIQPAFVRQAERAARWRRAPVRALLSVLLLTGITASALQLAYLYRAEAVAWQPRIKPVLDTVCATLGCSVEPLHRIQDVSIDSHSLAKADKGYELQVLLKNRAALASAFPDIELTLTDLTDMPIARRVVLPADYLARNTDAAAGIPARGEYKAVLRFDTQNLPINGYRLIVFYP